MLSRFQTDSKKTTQSNLSRFYAQKRVKITDFL
jgi:hypothetical protein